MPFHATGSITRQIRTRDPVEATAYMAHHVRPGIVTGTRADTELNFQGQYFCTGDFMAGLTRIGPGWNFQPLFELDAVMVWMALNGKITVRHTKNEAAASPDNILISSARSTHRVITEDGFDGFVIGVCSDGVRKAMSDFIGYRVGPCFDFLTQTESQSRLGSTLQAYGAALHCGLVGDSPLLSSPIGLKRSQDAFVNLVLMTAGADKVSTWGEPVAASVRELRRAEDFMQANAIEPIGIGDVAAYAGVSVRSLQYAFKRHRGTTPLAVLQRFRLEGVKAVLENGEGDTVAAVAARWGFSHPGRFSAQYRSSFGEKPSETLARRRNRGD